VVLVFKTSGGFEQNSQEVRFLSPPFISKGIYMEDKICEHKFVFLRSYKHDDWPGGYNTEFTRIDFFFCEKCLEQREINKRGWSRETPDWYLAE
jgi:hypothetical protein